MNPGFMNPTQTIWFLELIMDVLIHTTSIFFEILKHRNGLGPASLERVSFFDVSLPRFCIYLVIEVLIFVYVLFGCTCIHLNLCVLKWVVVKLSLNSTSTHFNIRIEVDTWHLIKVLGLVLDACVFNSIHKFHSSPLQYAD